MCTGNKLETNEARFLHSPRKAMKLGQRRLQLALDESGAWCKVKHALNVSVGGILQSF